MCLIWSMEKSGLGQRQAEGSCIKASSFFPPQRVSPALVASLKLHIPVHPSHLVRAQRFPCSSPQPSQLPVDVSQPLRGFSQGFPFIFVLKLCAFIKLKLGLSLFP